MRVRGGLFKSPSDTTTNPRGDRELGSVVLVVVEDL